MPATTTDRSNAYAALNAWIREMRAAGVSLSVGDVRMARARFVERAERGITMQATTQPEGVSAVAARFWMARQPRAIKEGDVIDADGDRFEIVGPKKGRKRRREPSRLKYIDIVEALQSTARDYWAGRRATR